jgi:hypothetical protein
MKLMTAGNNKPSVRGIHEEGSGLAQSSDRDTDRMFGVWYLVGVGIFIFAIAYRSALRLTQHRVR